MIVLSLFLILEQILIKSVLIKKKKKACTGLDFPVIGNSAVRGTKSFSFSWAELTPDTLQPFLVSELKKDRRSRYQTTFLSFKTTEQKKVEAFKEDRIKEGV